MFCVIWKGVVSFGFVYIFVVLYLVICSDDFDFDWFDCCMMDCVGYKCINKIIGKEVLCE